MYSHEVKTSHQKTLFLGIKISEINASRKSSIVVFLNYFIQEHFKKEKEGNCQNNRTDLVLQLHFITRADGDVKKPNHTRTRTVGYLGYHGSRPRIGWRK